MIPAPHTPSTGSPPLPYAVPPVHPVQPVTPRKLPADATEGGLAFHRLVFARKRIGWWTPLVTGLLGVAFYLTFMLVVLVVLLFVSFMNPSTLAGMADLAENPSFDLGNPFLVAIMLGTIALMWPSYLLASLIVNGPRVGLISSAAGRLRWRWMLLCGGVAAGLSLALMALSMLIPGEDVPSEDALAQNPLWLATLIVILIVVPFQAAAEEYIFRGYLMQAIGRWLRHPAFAILLPVPLFVFGHLYDIIGLTGVAVFAIGAGWLTWRTGGLEAAIALHVVNNLSAFVLSLFAGSDPTASSPGVVSLVWSVLLVGGFVGIVEALLRRRPLARTLVLTPPAPPVYPAFAPYGAYPPSPPAR